MIAIDKNALKLNDICGGRNFIRLHDFEPHFQLERCFIAVAHEIFRFALNENFSKSALGKDNAIKLFLSHSKQDEWAVNLAISLKRFIDDSPMLNFFDATDIAPRYRFDKEIMGHILESTFLSIHSDFYSSRYWCQREVLYAKEQRRPILSVDCLNDSEDRKFPFATNVPSIHLHPIEEWGKDDIHRILEAAILETIRFNYHGKLLKEYQRCGWAPSDALVLSRPPEISDLPDLLIINKGIISRRVRKILYPEPPVYSEEHEFLDKIGISAVTPLTSVPHGLEEHFIGISISNPSDDDLLEIGLSSEHLKIFSQETSRHILARNAGLIYGGDLRPGGFTNFILDEAEILQSRLQSVDVRIKNYLSWPMYLEEDPKFKDWKAHHRDILEVVEVLPPKDVESLVSNINEFLLPDKVDSQYIWSKSLTHMRQSMVDNSCARICAGGKLTGYIGRMPGVLEEIMIAIEKKKPLFLIGGFGGVTSKVCSILQGGYSDELTLKWQIQNNPKYKALTEFINAQYPFDAVDYNQILSRVKEFGVDGLSKCNGLTPDENCRLFATQFNDEAIHLVIKGLKKTFKGITKVTGLKHL